LFLVCMGLCLAAFSLGVWLCISQGSGIGLDGKVRGGYVIGLDVVTSVACRVCVGQVCVIVGVPLFRVSTFFSSGWCCRRPVVGRWLLCL
jgi:hypothetical protein